MRRHALQCLQEDKGALYLDGRTHGRTISNNEMVILVIFQACNHKFNRKETVSISVRICEIIVNDVLLKKLWHYKVKVKVFN